MAGHCFVARMQGYCCLSIVFQHGLMDLTVIHALDLDKSEAMSNLDTNGLFCHLWSLLARACSHALTKMFLILSSSSWLISQMPF